MNTVEIPIVSLFGVEMPKVEWSSERKKIKPPFVDVDNLLIDNGDNLLMSDGGCLLIRTKED